MNAINAKFDVKQTFNFFLQFQKEIYPDINNYLTTMEEPDYRGIRKDVLEFYRVGVGKEKFRND